MKACRLIKSTASIIISVGVLFTSFMLPDKFSAQEISVEYQHYDISELEIALSKFDDQLREDNNDDGVAQGFNSVLTEKNKIETQRELAYINYAVDTNQENTDEYIYMCQTQSEGMGKIYTALNNALNTKYRELIKELLGDFYSAIDEYDISSEEQTEIIVAEQNIQQEYQEILKSSKSTSDKNLECAALYLKLVKVLNNIVKPYDCNYLEYIYYFYNRDYTVDDITALSPYVKTDIADCYHRVTNNIESLPGYSEYTGANNLFENNFEVIKCYAGEISYELYESAEFITDNNLYKFGNGNNSINMAFTTMLPQYNTAFIYQYLYSNQNDILSSIHEFGHFNTMRHCDISSSIEGASINLDISEVQSQGLEVLYTRFYNNMFGEYAELLRRQQYADILQSISSGFMVNEFENYVFNNAENMTPGDVVDKYKSTSDEYKVVSIPFYKIHHLFRTPGYYISYATSALAAVGLCDVLDSSFDDAADMYTAFSHFDPTDDDNKYKECLEKSGFGNVLSTEYIRRIASITDNVLDNSVYADIDGNGIVSASDAVIMKIYILDTTTVSVNNENKKYDLNKDTVVNAADLCRLIDILLCE